jgi:hypothetical protein
MNIHTHHNLHDWRIMTANEIWYKEELEKSIEEFEKILHKEDK